MSAETGLDSTFRNKDTKDAIRTLDHYGQLSAPTVDPPAFLCRTGIDVDGSNKTLLVVHSQLTQLHLIVDDRLQRIWNFEKAIATFCWNDAENAEKGSRNTPELLVGTADGQIWNVALLKPTVAPLPPKKIPESALRTIIKIEDDDDNDIEEIELWNDEDGLLDGIDQIQDVVEPPFKRQRTGSSSSQISEKLDKHQEHRVETIKISASNNLIGSEPGLGRIAKAWDRLMVFRQNEEPVLWSSESRFQPGHTVSKVLVPLDRPFGIATADCQDQEEGLFVGTRDGSLWRFTASHHDRKSFKATATCCKLIDEPILALQKLHLNNNPGSQLESIVAVGASGNFASLDIPVSPDDPLATQNIRRKNVVTPVHGAVVAGDYFYIMTAIGEVHRISRRPFQSSDVDVELVQVPPLLALIPVVTRNALVGFYGLAQGGSVVHITMDLKTTKRDREIMDSRHNIDDLLQDLERLNKQARDLESECQAQNTRIASYNQVAHTLQSAVLAFNSNQGQGEPLVDLSVTAIVRNVTKGYTGQRQNVAQIRISSTLDLDWSHGWSVVFRTMESRPTCPHEDKIERPLQHEVFADLSDLSPRSPWIQELELDMSQTRLPLLIHIGLQYSEMAESGDHRYTSYFFIESFGLDVLHFSNPLQDPVNGITGNLMLKGKSVSSGDQQTRHQQFSGTIVKAGGTYCPKCKDDAISGARDPLVFSFDTTDIKFEQCLSAILADSLPSDRVQAMIQTAVRAALVVPDICLPDVNVAEQNAKTVDTNKTVWINLEEQGRHDTAVSASLQVKGADPWRVALVHQALRKRIDALFD